MMIQTVTQGLALKVNGSVLAIGKRPHLEELEPALRGIALSDSPVWVRADSLDADHVVQRLHQLGRRSELPLRSIHDEREAEPLFSGVHQDGVDPKAVGTWALHHAHWWPKERQLQLAHLLQDLDSARLHGRLSHERIPRIVVVNGPEDRAGKLEPALEQRLSFFHIVVSHTKKGLS